MAINRWLPQNSIMNSGMGSSSVSGWTVATALAAAATAFFIGRPYLGPLISLPETTTQIKQTADAQSVEIKSLTQELVNTQREILNIQHQIARMQDEWRHQQEKQLVAEERARDAEKHARELETAQRALVEAQRGVANLQRQLREQREREARLASQNNQFSRPPTATEPANSTVSVRELHQYKYEYTVIRGTLVETDRAFYRDRFSKGCTVPPSAIIDLALGFIIRSDWCEPSTFAGFEFVQAPGSRVGALPGVGSN